MPEIKKEATAEETAKAENPETTAKAASPEKTAKAENPETTAKAASPEKTPKTDGSERKAKADSPEKKAKPGSPEKKAASAKSKGTAAAKDGASSKATRARKPAGKAAGRYQARLKARYRETISPELFKEFGFRSPMQIPRIEKIIVSAGVGEAVANKKFLDSVVAEIEQITGQKPIRTRARKSIANFKIREGMEIGAKVTLRGDRMYEFLDRLVNVALPRVKDFRGIKPKAFDGRGNFSLGIDEQIIFPEIDYDKIEQVRGLNVAIVTNAPNDDQARSLLGKFGMPFSKE